MTRDKKAVVQAERMQEVPGVCNALEEERKGR